jgi:hypothetical protein
MQNFLLYQAYGNIDHINECRYALLRYLEVYNLKPPKDIGLIIYTDQPAYFENFTPFFDSFEMKEISETQVKEWRGEANCQPRVKMEIIREFLNNVNGNLLYCDGDTYITAPIHPLFTELEKGHFCVYEDKTSLSREALYELQSLKKHITQNELNYKGKRVELSGSTNIWNTAVVGISSDKKYLADDILALTDSTFQQFKKPIAGPFAISYILQNEGTVKTASGFIQHYGALKEFRSLLRIFFKKNEEESIPNLVKLVHRLDAIAIRQFRNKFDALPFYKKLIYSLTGKGWNIKQYERKI